MSKSNRKAFPEIRFRPCDLREKPQFEPNRFENMEILVRFDPINVYHGRIAEREKLIKEIQEKGMNEFNDPYSLVKFVVQREVFQVDVDTLIWPIKRPDCEGKDNNVYKEHFFVKMIRHCLEKRGKTDDPREITEINVPLGNSNHFKMIFEYLEKCYNEEEFELKMPENMLALISLYETVCPFEIHGLSIIILESLKKYLDDELHRIKAY